MSSSFELDLFGENSAESKPAKSAEYIEELAAKILKYQKSYYTGEAEISDAEFDRLWDELKEIAPDHPVLQKVGSDLAENYENTENNTNLSVEIEENSAELNKNAGNFQKARHLIPMGSQEKAANPEQFLAWAQKHPYEEYLVEYKLDGASLEIQYQNGEFYKAVTRGDGEIGDDITRNVAKMQGLVLHLPGSFTGGVRGEVIMSHEVHRQKFADKANCRNAANGLMKRKDGEGSEYLQIICYDALFIDAAGTNAFSDEIEKMNWLKSAGFNTVPLQICASPQSVIDYRAEVMEKRVNLNYDIDGLVIKQKQIDLDDARRARPDKQIAFKFSLEEAVSVVRNVIWNENGATYTPVAEFDTVELAGTKVSRASLSNYNTIVDLGLKIGSHVVVTKRGEIIPKIEAVVKTEESEKEPKIEVPVPEKCGVCGTALINEGTRLYCPNHFCTKRLVHQLEKWADMAQIRDLGTTLIKDLVAGGAVKSLKDLYQLDEAKLSPFFLNEESLEKEKISLGARKVLASIQNSRKIKLSSFIAGFDIEGIGETMIEKLIDAGFVTLQGFLSAKTEDFAGVFGFAEITANTLVEGLKENAEEMRYLCENGIIQIEETVKKSQLLSGKSFCFTGELFTMKRAQAEQMVKDNGGACKSSVTKGLSYLVTNDTTSGSSKNVKAASLGIPIIDEKQFLALFE